MRHRHAVDYCTVTRYINYQISDISYHLRLGCTGEKKDIGWRVEVVMIFGGDGKLKAEVENLDG